MTKLPPLNALRCFESAARHRSFSRAAEELHVTQSAVSHQVRELEELNNRLHHILARHTGQTVEKIMRDTEVTVARPHSHWLMKIAI